MQDLYFFFEKSECKTRTPFKIGNSYLNHFAIEEDAAFEIKAIEFLRRSNAKMAEVWNEEEYEKYPKKRSFKERTDSEIIGSCMQRIPDFKNEDRQIHIIYASHYYSFRLGLSTK